MPTWRADHPPGSAPSTPGGILPRGSGDTSPLGGTWGLREGDAPMVFLQNLPGGVVFRLWVGVKEIIDPADYPSHL
ncbi:hypothetical protein CCHOA_01880 [Corynebacterium choanae]|uniref:Uncharacterized protein n=1 Tax=Corynebacterium choanae TaxID=1862358 RepID=A0A3G6J4Y7_9CORY|nr:hypothetical protein CCHOA_01880 [Corynebacterium choanae]